MHWVFKIAKEHEKQYMDCSKPSANG